MAKIQEYELYKQYLQSLNLSYEEYEKMINKWCKDNDY